MTKEKCKKGGKRLTFDGLGIDLEKIPNNEKWCRRAVLEIQHLRLASVVLNMNSRELEEAVHSTQSAEAFMSLAEQLIELREDYNGRRQTIEAAIARILIVLEREVLA